MSLWPSWDDGLLIPEGGRARTAPFYLDASEVFLRPGAISFVTKYPGRYLVMAQGAGGAGFYNSSEGRGIGGGGGGYAERVVDLAKGVQVTGTIEGAGSSGGLTTLSVAGFTLLGNPGEPANWSTFVGGSGGMGVGGTLNLRGGKGGDNGSALAVAGEGVYGGAAGTGSGSYAGGGGGASNSGFLRGLPGFAHNQPTGSSTGGTGGGRGGSGAYHINSYNFGSSGGAAIIYLGS